MDDHNNTGDSPAAPPTDPGAVSYGKPVSVPNPPYQPKMFNTFYWLWLGLGLAAIPLYFVCIGPFAVIASVVFWAMFLFKSWNQIQDGNQETSPGQAIGFMFIPLFNLYWQFIAIYKLTKNLNAYGRRHNIQFAEINEGMAKTTCILLCIPLANLVGAIMMFIVFNQIKIASMAIAQARL
ncbi:MAG: hypothetical protein KDA30_15940, partial [Phycisphaerales bacterium]|nr:hypothetical protein [Phycisphaerales bacterium]